MRSWWAILVAVVMVISVAAWIQALGTGQGKALLQLGRTAIGVVGGGLAAGWMVVILIAGRMLTLVVVGISAAARPHIRVPTGVLVVVILVAGSSVLARRRRLRPGRN